MQDYVAKAIELAKSEGGAVNNRRLKSLVEEETGRETGNGHWHILDAPLKDEPLAEGHAFVPYGKLWYYDPPVPILLGWVLATLARHEVEVIRCCQAVRLSRYVNAEQAQEVLGHLETLAYEIEKARDGIREAQSASVLPRRRRAVGS